ncbi:MAG: flagellar protein FhlB [Thiomicrospira sp.]|nr:MAG: flagellar protein FhlB [Thiomicrospira sp.]
MTKETPRNTTLDQKVAITLEYDGESAPKVTAKGSGTLAEQIIKVAKENSIPITEDHELVQLLAQVELDQEIPELLYEAVVQVLIFAYQLSEKEIPSPSRELETNESSNE